MNQHYNPVQNQSKKSKYLLQSSTLEFRSVSWIECLVGPSGFLMPIGHFHGHIPIKDFRFVHPRCSDFAMALLEARFSSNKPTGSLNARYFQLPIVYTQFTIWIKEMDCNKKNRWNCLFPQKNWESSSHPKISVGY